MTGRALVFSNEKVIRQLKARFVSYAGDKWYLNRQRDADGRFLARIASQRDGAVGGAGAPQGVYVATADGVLLAYDHFRPSAESFLALLDRAAAAAPGRAAEPSPVGVADEASPDPVFRREPPPGGRVLNVYTRIPLAPTVAAAWTPNQATGRDHLWLTAHDLRALRPPTWTKGRRYPVPPALTARVARFHLLDNVRGEPPFWTNEDVRASNLVLTVEDAAARRVRLDGIVRLSAPNGARTYDARVQGYLTWNKAAGPDGERLARFDWLAWGEASGEGTYTTGAPPGRFPLVVAASLAPAGDVVAATVPPQGAKEWDAYLNPAAR